MQYTEIKVADPKTTFILALLLPFLLHPYRRLCRIVFLSKPIFATKYDAHARDYGTIVIDEKTITGSVVSCMNM